MHDLLTEPIFRWHARDGAPGADSLPGLLARLAEPGCSIIGFDELQAHQQHPWHAFLVQIAAMACDRAGIGEALPTDPGWWHEQLLGLAQGDGSAWQLIVADTAKPAFLQAPLPTGLQALKNETRAADYIDLTMASKDLDTKHSRAVTGNPAIWCYALLTLQTCQGFSGKSNYGICRMNSGFGNRPGIAAAPGLDAGVRWRRDTAAARAAYDLAGSYGWQRGGIALLWLPPWDGASAIPHEQCDPYVIEICRRVRLLVQEDHIIARFSGSTTARLSGTEQLKGDVGDPWTPVDRGSSKALTLGGDGFTYKKVADLLCGSFADAPCARFTTGDRLWIGQALVRGSGKTDGLHTRILPVEQRAIDFLQEPVERERLGVIASEMIEDAKMLRLSLLKPALCALHQPNQTDKTRLEDAHADRYLDEAEQGIDRIFFTALWQAAEDPEWRGHWQMALRDLGKSILEEAIDRMPEAPTYRYRAIAAAEALFHGGVRKRFQAIPQEVHP
ncbi:MAG: type I-E CRISPR-associated protein Cse1/CasA [Planctomycetota bacterium]